MAEASVCLVGAYMVDGCSAGPAGWVDTSPPRLGLYVHMGGVVVVVVKTHVDRIYVYLCGRYPLPHPCYTYYQYNSNALMIIAILISLIIW